MEEVKKEPVMIQPRNGYSSAVWGLIIAGLSLSWMYAQSDNTNVVVPFFFYLVAFVVAFLGANFALVNKLKGKSMTALIIASIVMITFIVQVFILNKIEIEGMQVLIK